MRSVLRAWFKRPDVSRPPSSTGGRLVYAVGDVHGRNDLLVDLLDRIAADRKGLVLAEPTLVVLLGDYIDRGPQSREVIDTVRQLMRASDLEVRALKGNHEQQMLLFLEDASAGPPWAAYGGRETLMSYGVRPPPAQAPADAWEAARLALVETLPADHLDFLKALELTVVCGDYLFVHAGVRPGVPLSECSEADLLSIRDEFLNAVWPSDKVVVHGHTPSPEPQLQEHRIGVDTGAFATGRLTAVRLYGTDRAILQTVDR